MTALTATATPKPNRRAKAAKTVDRALRSGILAGAAAAVAWLIASAFAATAVFVLVIATVLAAVYTVARGDKARLGVWGLLAIGWVLVVLERWVVNQHGGLWVALAAWIGVVVGARRAGIGKRWLALLAYPVALGVIVKLAGEPLDDPWGVSWLWVAAILGPVIGLRTLLNLSPKQDQAGSTSSAFADQPPSNARPSPSATSTMRSAIRSRKYRSWE